MLTGALLDREEYIEQAYFFRVFRERLASELVAQEILQRIHEEILSTTRLPYAIQFLASELKHTGLLSSGFARLPHYFTPFQTFVLRQTEEDTVRISIETALLVLEREAFYRSGEPTRPGMFMYQFEVLCRNRLGAKRPRLLVLLEGRRSRRLVLLLLLTGVLSLVALQSAELTPLRAAQPAFRLQLLQAI